MNQERPEALERLRKLVFKKSTDYLHRDAMQFLDMAKAAKLYVFRECIIVVRHDDADTCFAWLFFEKFTRRVVWAMGEVSRELVGVDILVSTKDLRIERILHRMSYKTLARHGDSRHMIRGAICAE